MKVILSMLAAVGMLGAADLSRSPRQASSAQETPIKVPFKVGERLTYAAKVNFVNAGQATMSVEGIETIRDHPTYHTIFDVKGRVLFFHVNDHYESWFDTTSLVSLHHVQHIDESNNKIDKVYDFYPERRV